MRTRRLLYTNSAYRGSFVFFLWFGYHNEQKLQPNVGARISSVRFLQDMLRNITRVSIHNGLGDQSQPRFSPTQATPTKLGQPKFPPTFAYSCLLDLAPQLLDSVIAFIRSRNPSQWPVCGTLYCQRISETEILTDFDRVQELVPAQPVGEGPPERVRDANLEIAPSRGLTWRPLQHQEAEDPEVPLAQGYRPQVPEKPQACAPRHRQGSGTHPRITARPTRRMEPMMANASLQKEIKEGKREA